MAKPIGKERSSPTSVAPEAPLSGELAEFREALRAEVKAAQRAAASNAIALSNGRLIGTLAQAFQYQFSIESALDLPADTPGELRLPNQESLRVSLVGIEGLSLTLSVERHLGAFVPHATLQSNLTMLLLKLIERIEAKAAVPNPAGERLLGKTSPSGEAESISNATLGLPDDQCLNPHQLDAVASALGRDTTYIWGPPGTGKTHTIGAIATELLRRGRSVLLVSHTNVAVDEAILKIAQAVRSFDPEAIETGRIVRVGNPSPRWPRTDENEALLLEEQAKRRAAALTARQTELTADRMRLLPRQTYLTQLIQLHEFLAEADEDVESCRASLARIDELAAQSSSLQEAIDRAQAQAGKDEALGQMAEAAVRAADQRAPCRQRWEQQSHQLETMRRQMAQVEAATQAAQTDLGIAIKIQPYRQQLAGRRPLDEAQRVATGLAARQTAADADVQRAKTQLQDAERLWEEVKTLAWIKRKWRGLPDPETQALDVELRREDLEAAQKVATQLAELRSRAGEEVRYTQALIAFLEPHAHLGTSDELEALAQRCRRECDRLRTTLRELEASFAQTDAAWRAIEQAIDRFDQTGLGNPHAVLARLAQSRSRLNELHAALRKALDEQQEESERLEATLAPRLALVTALGFAAPVASEVGLHTKLNTLESAVVLAHRQANQVPLQQATHELDELRHRLMGIAEELGRIDVGLRQIELTVLREATIIGATLTASYLRDALQNRRFDTVILDEASMAPIPALWMAASVCDRAVVVVGDFKQLPPVVVANPEKQKGDSGAELAQKWLGTDVFRHNGLERPEHRPTCFVALQEQRRMHPAISAIANELSYEFILRDHPGVTHPNHAVIDWIAPHWSHDTPVLLVDTGPLHAWVTSVVRGTGASPSRLNFMSATVCADLATAMLGPAAPDTDPTAAGAGAEPRILIVSPYRPHTKLVDLLLKDSGLDGPVKAGTVHSFQGSEADVVIFDLVNDEPHRRVGLFAPAYSDAHQRMFNVAVTRARKRLIVVGDFSYCVRHGKRAFLGSRFLPLLMSRHPVVDARTLVPEGLASRAAAAKLRVVGGPVEAPHERLIVRQDEFFPLFYSDLHSARERVIVYSPFITSNRLSQVEAPLRAAAERGARVVVVTKPIAERDRSQVDTYRDLEKTLAKWGVRVVHKQAMHEKLALIDGHIVWAGSLNALSHSDTQEVMWRYDSPKVFEECAEKMQLDELLARFDGGAPSCPNCSASLMAAEGTTSPLYLRCSNPKCCFTLSLKEDSIQDGLVVCKRCGANVRLRSQDKDGRPRWICTVDPTHKRLVKPMHLKLPKMRVQIAARILERLERQMETNGESSPGNKCDDLDGQGKLWR